MTTGSRTRPSLAKAARILLLPYSIALALIVWLPNSEAKKATGFIEVWARWATTFGVPFETGYPVLEFTANIVLFIPLGALVKLAWPRLDWWRIALLGFATSALIEGVQFALPTRFPTVSDLIANTSGAVLGWALARWWLRRSSRAGSRNA